MIPPAGGASATQTALLQAGSLGLAEEKRRFLDASMADGVGGRHSTGVRWWIIYLWHGLALSPVPRPGEVPFETMLAEEDLVEDWILWMAVHRPSGRQIGRKSLKKYESSFRAWHRRYARRDFGLGPKGSRVGDILKGYARLVDQPPPRERLGCTPADLAEGMSRQSISTMWRAAVSFGLVALARGCEFALDSGRREAFDPTQHMTVEDVSFFFGPDGVEHARVRMRKRKDLRLLRGKHAVVIIAGAPDGAHIDAVRALRSWIAVRRALGIADSRPLFCDEQGAGITVAQVRDMVKSLMEAVGRDPRLYGAHSLRIGGATAALAAGVSPQLIRLMGRWSSDIYEIYCRMSEEAALGVGAAICSAVVTDVEAGFHEEHLELTTNEVGFFLRERDTLGGEEGDDGSDEEEA